MTLNETSSGGDVTPFVLDLVENPHPRMLAEALAVRAAAETAKGSTGRRRRAFWNGYLAAMAAATGRTPADLKAWMDRHADAVPGHTVDRPGA